MSFTKNQIVSLIASTQTNPYDLVLQEEISDMVDYWAATIIRQTLQKDPRLSRFFLFPFQMPLEKVNKITCPIQYGCILRTIDMVPTPVMVNNSIFEYVGSADFERAFIQTYQHQLCFNEYRRYTGTLPAYIYLGGYIYVVNNDQIRNIGVQEITADLKGLSKFSCNNICFNEDTPLPYPDNIVQQIIQSIIGTEFRNKREEINDEVEVNKEMRSN